MPPLRPARPPPSRRCRKARRRRTPRSATGTKADPFQDLKRIVHQRLVEALGPKLYDAHMTQSELEQQVRLALQTAIADTDIPMSSADRTRISQEIADDILGYGPIEPLLRDSTLTEVMVNAFERSTSSAAASWSRPTRPSPTRPTCGAPSTRSSARSAAASTRRARWWTPACPTAAASTPSSRRWPSTGSKLTIRKFSEDPLHGRRPHQLRHPDHRFGRFPRRVRPRPTQHPRLRRHWIREDHDAQRALGLHPRRRAHRHHRGCRRAEAGSGPRAAGSSRGPPTSRARAPSPSVTW